MSFKRIAQKISAAVSLWGFTLFTIGVSATIAADPSATKITTTITNTKAVVNNLIILAFSVAVLVFAFGVVKFITAAGDPVKLQKAKGIIVWGIVGLAVLASITGLITYLGGYFGVDTTNSATITPPQF